MLRSVSKRLATELACTMLPMPKEAMAVNRQNNIASHFAPNPLSSAYIGPPSISPLLVLTLNFTASSPSLYLVAMPNTPVIQHQNTAPGPPNAMAVPTPTKLPVPMVAARAVASALNALTSPLVPLSLENVSLIALNMYRCGNCSRIVRNMCVPTNRRMSGHPHSDALTFEIIDSIVSNEGVVNRYYIAKLYCKDKFSF